MAALAPKVNGVWVLDKSKSDAMAPFLKEMGAPWIAQKAVDLLTPSWTITLEVAALTQLIVGLRTMTNVTKFGDQPSPYLMGDGSTATATVVLNGECIMLTVHHPAKGAVTTSCALEGEHLLSTISVKKKDGSLLSVKRYFKRKP